MGNIVKISVIIPCYNVKKFLGACFDVLQSQILKEMEFIFIDDGSNQDNTPEILDKFAMRDNRVVVIHQNHKGLGEARNTGMRIAKGEYIGFLDPDDSIPENYYETLYKTAKKYDADVAWTNFLRCSPKIHLWKDKYCTYFPEEDILMDITSRFNAMGSSCYVMSKIYRTTFLVTEDEHLFFDRPFYEDIMFTVRILYEANKIVVTPNTVYRYLFNPRSITRRYQTFKLQYHHYEALKSMRSFLMGKRIAMPKKLKFLRKWNIGIGRFSLLMAKDYGRYTLVVLFNFIPIWITFNNLGQ